MSKHTAGPWWIDTAEDVDLPNHVGISADEHGLLAQVVWRMEDDERTPQCEANARLIAAAPDLLEVLEWFMPFIESEQDDERQAPWVEKARATITKAKGE